MGNQKNRAGAAKKGIFQTLLSYLQRSKLGELLVSTGRLSPSELRRALRLQKETGAPLGAVLVKNEVLTPAQLRKILIRQHMLRCFAGFLLFFMTLTNFTGKRAHAEIRDVPAKIALSASADFQRIAYYPQLFGSEEERSTKLKPFTKWTGMFDRFERHLRSSSSQQEMQAMVTSLSRYSHLSLKKMAARVNDFMNAKPYILDNKLWGKSDYWATPVEFMRYGGDCEDFAIAKYTALRALGVPEERLRLAIVHDNIKNIPHAVLVVYTDEGAYVLDNQIKTLVQTETQERYRPIYSINRHAWWLHTAPKRVVLASAR